MVVMQLYLCEKPSQAKDIAAVLGAKRRGDGCWLGTNVTVTWCIGHLLETAPPDAYDARYKRWVLADLPIIPDKWKMTVKPRTATVQRQIVTDHRHFAHGFRPVADQRRAFDRGGNLAVFDQVRLAGGEHELAAGDVHLTAAEVGAVDAAFHRGDDFCRGAFARQHVGVGHPRHRQVRVGFTTTVTGAGHAHQARVELVLHVAFEHAVFDQRGALGRGDFVIDAQRATTTRQGAVIDDGAELGRNHLAHAPAVGRTALAVEVAFQAVADRFVQQHTGPTRTQHHRQRTSRRRNRFQVHQRLTQRFTGVAHGTVVAEKITIIGTTAAAMTTALAAAVLFNDHADVEAHQWPHIRRQAAVGGSHENALPNPGHAHGDLLDTRVEGTGRDVDTLEQFDFFGAGHHFQRVVRTVQLGDILGGERLHRAVLPGSGDRTRGTSRRAERFEGDGVAIGKTGFLTRLRPHADALVEVEAAFLDDAVFQRPGLGNLALEIQIGSIDARAGQIAEHTLQALDGHAAGR